MLETHRIDRKILEAAKRIRVGTAAEIQQEISRVEVDAPDLTSVRRHLWSLSELGFMTRLAVVRDRRAVILWKNLERTPGDESTHEQA